MRRRSLFASMLAAFAPAVPAKPADTTVTVVNNTAGRVVTRQIGPTIEVSFEPFSDEFAEAHSSWSDAIERQISEKVRSGGRCGLNHAGRLSR